LLGVSNKYQPNLFNLTKFSRIMKRVSAIISFIGILFLSNIDAQENVLFIAPGPVGTLNDKIKSDTLANGTRVANRVYELQRGAPYLINNEIQNAGFPLVIRARAGAGARPIIIFSSSGSGAAIDQLFRTGGDLKLTNLHLSGKDNLAAGVSAAVRHNLSGAKLEIDSCLIDDFAQTSVRLNVANTKAIIKNSIINRMGSPKDPDNGRVLDDRGLNQDTMILENNIIYNVTSRVIRNGTAGTVDKFVKIDQNTIWGVGQRGLQIGKVINLTVTNNIFQNCAVFGVDAAATTPTTVLEPDTTFLGQNWLVSNNNFSSDAKVVAALPARVPDGGTTLKVVNSAQAKNYNPVVTAIAKNTFTESITYKNPPVPIDYFVVDQKGDTTLAGTLRPNARQWDHSGIPKNTDYSVLGTPAIDRFSVGHDFAYGTWRPAYKNGTTGQPLGSTLSGFTTSTSEIAFDNNTVFYPNPVENRLFIQNTDKFDIATVTVFNINGAVVSTVNNVKTALYELNLNDMTAGLYIVKVLKSNGKLSVSKVTKL
jgi:hypothetical protein